MALMTLASLDELPEGGQLRVELDDLTLLLCHLDGTVYASTIFAPTMNWVWRGATCMRAASPAPIMAQNFD